MYILIIDISIIGTLTLWMLAILGGIFNMGKLIDFLVRFGKKNESKVQLLFFTGLLLILAFCIISFGEFFPEESQNIIRNVAIYILLSYLGINLYVIVFRL